MRSRRVRMTPGRATRFLLIGLGIGLVLPFFLGGEASFMFRVSPLLGALLGGAMGIIVGWLGSEPAEPPAGR